MEDTTPNLNKIKYCLLFASSLTILASATMAPALPQMSEFFASIFNDTSRAEFWSKIVIAIPGISIAIVAPLVGYYVDKVEKKSLLLIFLLLYFLAGVGAWWVYRSIELLLLSRFLLGVAVAGVMVSVTTLATEFFKGPALAKYMGLQAAFGSFGGVLFLALGGVLADFHWTYVFSVYAVSLLFVPAVWFWLKPSVNDAEQRNNVKTDERVASRGLVLCCVLAFVEVFILYLIPLQYPFVAVKLGKASSTEIGLSLAAIFMLLALVSMQYHKIKGNLSYFTVQSFGYLLIAFGLLITGQTQTYGWAFSGVLLSALGFGIIRPNLMMYLFSFIPLHQRGKAMGIVTSFFFLAQFCSPLFIQPLVGRFGLSATFSIFAVFSFVMAITLTLYVFLSKRPTSILSVNRAS